MEQPKFVTHSKVGDYQFNMGWHMSLPIKGFIGILITNMIGHLIWLPGGLLGSVEYSLSMYVSGPLAKCRHRL